QHLTDVHTRRHAQRVQHDVDRRTVLAVGHVIDRNDRGNNTLVTVAAGHLVARLHAALHREVHLHHIQNAGGQIVARGDLRLLVVEALLERLTLQLQTLGGLLELCVGVFVLQTNLEPLLTGQLIEILGDDLRAGLELLGTARDALTDEETAHALEQVVLQDALLVGEVLTDTLDFRLLDGEGTRVFINAIAREHANVDHSAVHARRHAQARVLNVGSLLTEDRAQQLLFRGELGFALRRHFAHQNVARLHFGADERNTGLVELRQSGITDVRNVRRDFLWTQLRVTRDARELLDVNRGEAVFLHDALGDEDRVLEVVAVPGHERDEQVLPERELAEVGRRAVSQHVATRDVITRVHQRTLVDTGVLVRARVLREVVDVHARLAGGGLVVIHTHHDAGRVDGVHEAAALGDDRNTGVDGYRTLHSGADERHLGTQGRHRLALHVRAHERAVRVVMLEERDERGRHGHDLLRAHVHVVDAIARHQSEFVLIPAGHQLVQQLAVRAEHRVRLRDREFAFLDGGQIVDLLSDTAVVDTAVRRLEEAILVRPRVHRQRVDQSDVRTFRRFDRADAAVVSRVHVAHFESRALAGQTAWAQGRDAALVGDLGQRVVLVHELRELRGAEKFLHGRRDGLRVDHFLRHERLGLGDCQALLDGALDTHEADAEGVLRHLADATNATVAEVVDVVNLAVTVTDVDQHLQHIEDVGGLAVRLDQPLGGLVAAGAEVLMVVQDARAGDFLAAD